MWIAAVGSAKLFPNLEAALKGVFNRVLTELNLADNRIGVEGSKAIAEALKVNPVYLNSNSIGGDGAKAIAEALKVNPVLTKLNLWVNNLGDAGKQAVQDAVKGRSGFQLHL